MAYGMVSAIPQVHLFVLLLEGSTYTMFIWVLDTPSVTYQPKTLTHRL